MSQATNEILVVLGSGGHTAEILKVIECYILSTDKNFESQSFLFLLADSDKTSMGKAISVMTCQQQNSYRFVRFPRSREVGQPYYTAFFTTLWAFLWSFWIVWNTNPKVILCNGPGTCVPICIASLILRALRRLPKKSKIIFIESFCRTSSLSLTGKILLRIADLFIVQWSKVYLKYQKRKNVKYFGCLM